MIVSAWFGGTYGIRVGRANARKYFSKEWSDIEVEIDGAKHLFSLSSTFWTTCPEFRGEPVTKWFKKLNIMKWPKGNPPKFELIPIGSNRFRLAFINDDMQTLFTYTQIKF